MVFSSVTFLGYFLPAALLLYYLLPWKNFVLLLVSLAFYAWGDLASLPVLLVYIVVNYVIGRLMERPGWRGSGAVLGVVANLGLLITYKYAGFLVTQANVVLASLGAGVLPVPALVLPLGISFFSFQGISYILDIRRGVIRPQRSLIAFGMYKAMFPQLIAGPIVRYRTIAGRVTHRRVSAFRFRFGLTLLILGLAQKVLIANTVALPADQIFAIPHAQLGFATAWFGAICYTLQIFFDFAGYSTMAIGMAHLFGFNFPINFNRPYIAQSVTEFWRRWHITLSTWFRDYLYIPLGGNRGSAWSTYRNLLIVFVLCGFWHGAAWTFLAWGLYHGALLAAERAGLGAFVASLWRPLRHLYLLVLVVIGWVFFRADTIGQALHFLAAMAGLSPGDPLVAPLARFVNIRILVALAAGCVFACLALSKGRSWMPLTGRPQAATGLLLLRDGGAYAVLLALFAATAIMIASGAYNPFIYYRF